MDGGCTGLISGEKPIEQKMIYVYYAEAYKMHHSPLKKRNLLQKYTHDQSVIGVFVCSFLWRMYVLASAMVSHLEMKYFRFELFKLFPFSSRRHIILFSAIRFLPPVCPYCCMYLVYNQ